MMTNQHLLRSLEDSFSQALVALGTAYHEPMCSRGELNGSRSESPLQRVIGGIGRRTVSRTTVALVIPSKYCMRESIEGAVIRRDSTVRSAAVTEIIELRLNRVATMQCGKRPRRQRPLAVLLARDHYANIADQGRNSDLRLLTLQ